MSSLIIYHKQNGKQCADTITDRRLNIFFLSSQGKAVKKVSVINSKLKETTKTKAVFH